MAFNSTAPDVTVDNGIVTLGNHPAHLATRHAEHNPKIAKTSLWSLVKKKSQPPHQWRWVDNGTSVNPAGPSNTTAKFSTIMPDATCIDGNSRICILMGGEDERLGRPMYTVTFVPGTDWLASQKRRGGSYEYEEPKVLSVAVSRAHGCFGASKILCGRVSTSNAEHLLELGRYISPRLGAELSESEDVQGVIKIVDIVPGDIPLLLGSSKTCKTRGHERGCRDVYVKEEADRTERSVPSHFRQLNVSAAAQRDHRRSLDQWPSVVLIDTRTGDDTNKSSFYLPPTKEGIEAVPKLLAQMFSDNPPGEASALRQRWDSCAQNASEKYSEEPRLQTQVTRDAFILTALDKEMGTLYQKLLQNHASPTAIRPVLSDSTRMSVAARKELQRTGLLDSRCLSYPPNSETRQLILNTINGSSVAGLSRGGPMNNEVPRPPSAQIERLEEGGFDEESDPEIELDAGAYYSDEGEDSEAGQEYPPPPYTASSPVGSGNAVRSHQ